MGRKSAKKSVKAKDKKLKRKEDLARLGAKQSVVDAANAQDDPMADWAPFKSYNRNDLHLTIGCHRATDLDEGTINWGFQLTKTNMQHLYEDSEWGWNDKQKLEEMTDDKAWYLLARDEENQPAALVHFRYDLDFEEEVLYCYEIQLTEAVRRKGLGKFLMQILELLAHKSQMKKVMCTVFNNNNVSRSFFINKLKYEVDDTSPDLTVEDHFFDEDEYTYQILCKKIVPKTKTSTAASPTKSANATVSKENAQSGHVNVQS